MRVTALSLLVIMCGRTAQLQLFADERPPIARTDRKILSAERGNLLDRTGLPLAITERIADVYIDARGVAEGRADWNAKDRAKLETELAGIAQSLRLSPESFAASLSRNSRWVRLAKGVNADVARTIREQGLSLVTVVDRPRRVYPDGGATRGIVGKVSPGTEVGGSGADLREVDGIVGSTGLEALFNDELTGTPGELLTERGPGNREIPSPKRRMIPANKGQSFVLSIDRSFQYRVDELLREAVLDYGAIGGYIGVMDVQTGDVLASSAMAVDPKTGEVRPKGYNAAVIDVYEPGSTMKPFTIAHALDSGVVSSERHFDVDDNLTMKWRRESKTFTDDVPHPIKSWTVRDILVNSSNIGTIMVSRMLGADAVNDNLKAFGFGTRTGVADPATESRGIMKETKDWSGVDIGTVPIGQGIAVTPLQMLAGLNTLAADGEYVAPRLVTASIDPDGTRTDLAPKRRRVIRAETAAEVRSILADAVRVGTAKRAGVSGYDVAGKTGTAQKPEKGRYASDAYIASFGGFFPAKAPRLTMIVVLDEPYAEYGGLTAAPVYADLVRLAAQRFRIAPVEGSLATGSAQVLASPELRAVNDPSRGGQLPDHLRAPEVGASSIPAGVEVVDAADPLEPAEPVDSKATVPAEVAPKAKVDPSTAGAPKAKVAPEAKVAPQAKVDPSTAGAPKAKVAPEAKVAPQAKQRVTDTSAPKPASEVADTPPATVARKRPAPKAKPTTVPRNVPVVGADDASDAVDDVPAVDQPVPEQDSGVTGVAGKPVTEVG
jgi:cell division protein FtsI (penicillin-binding protein 3)